MLQQRALTLGKSPLIMSVEMAGGMMERLPRYIVWRTDHIDLSDEWQRRWYIRQVLMYGRAEDVVRLDWDEVERLLPELNLRPTLHQLWESYFHARKTAGIARHTDEGAEGVSDPL